MRVRRAVDLKPGKPTTWLARGFLPRAAVAVLVGDEGIGKSLWWVLIAAHLTTGLACRALGIPARDPGDVVLVLTEDRWADVRARLELAGADLGRVHVISEDDDGTGSPTFPNDFVLVDDWLREMRPALVVVDAWADTVPGALQLKDPQQSRRALHPWRERAERFGPSVLLIGHTNRQDTDNLRDLVGMTASLRQKARVLLFAAAPPDGGGVLYVGPDKANGTGEGDAVRHQIEAQQVRQETDDDPGTVPRLRVTGSAGMTIRKQFAHWRQVAHEEARPPTADERAEAWVRDHLAGAGDTPVEDAKKRAADDGVNPKRLTPAVRRLGGTAGPPGAGEPWVYRISQSLQSLTYHLEAGKSGETGESPGHRGAGS